MKRSRMSDPRREWYVELCHESGIDPQLPADAYDDEPRERDEPPRRRRGRYRHAGEVPAGVWLRVFWQILWRWSLLVAALWWLTMITSSTDPAVWYAIGLLGLVFAAIGFWHRHEWDAVFYAARWAPVPAVVFVAVFTVWRLGLPFDLAPQQTAGTDPAPTARPSGGGGGAQPTAQVLRPTPDAAIVIVPTPFAVAAVDVAQPVAQAIAEAQPAAAAAGAQNAGQVAIGIVAGAYDAGQVAADTGAAMVSSAQAAGSVVAEVVEAAVDAREAGQVAEQHGAPAAVGQAASGVVTAGEAAAGVADAAVDAAQPVAEAVATAAPAAAESGAKNAGDAAVKTASVFCWLIGCGR